jgi:uncharacterized protein (UPF0548 family)
LAAGKRRVGCTYLTRLTLGQATAQWEQARTALGRWLDHQLTVLLAAIRALHLNPTPLTPASFAGIAPHQHSLNGD